MRLEQKEPGFRSERILTFRLRWPAPRSMEEVVRRRDFTRELLARIKAMPATDEAGLTTLLPVSPGVSSAALWVEGRPPVPMDQAQAEDLRLISPGYFRVLGIP